MLKPKHVFYKIILSHIYRCLCKEPNISIKRYIESDVFRYRGQCNKQTLINLYLDDDTFRWQCYFRTKQFQGKIDRFSMFFLRNNAEKMRNRIIIPESTTIGYGLFIGHGGPVVISQSAVIGNNCNLSQFTTIGTNYSRAAIIGDNVYLGPNVCVVEDVIIGNNVTIGAGSVVTKDIPDDATAAGNYARVLNYNDPGRFITNKWVR